MASHATHAAQTQRRGGACRFCAGGVGVCETIAPPIVGLAPEGGDSIDGNLARPAPGVGRFGLLLSSAGLRFIPVGAYEADGVFTIHFGEAYDLSVPRGSPSDEKDAQAAHIIMSTIAKLLPMHLRGEFA